MKFFCNPMQNGDCICSLNIRLFKNIWSFDKMFLYGKQNRLGLHILFTSFNSNLNYLEIEHIGGNFLFGGDRVSNSQVGWIKLYLGWFSDIFDLTFTSLRTIWIQLLMYRSILESSQKSYLFWQMCCPWFFMRLRLIPRPWI